MRNDRLTLLLYMIWCATLTFGVACEARPFESTGIITQGNVDAAGLHLSGFFKIFTTTSEIDTVRINYLGKEAFIAIDPPQRDYAFDLTIPMETGEKVSIKDALVSITPLANGTEGYSLYYLVDTSLPMPPQNEVDLVGGGDCMRIGCEFLGLFVERGGLKDTDAVLDIGCGVGRMAYPLTQYLQPMTSYCGFDIIPSLISRAKASIAPSYPNFDFQLVNIYNKMYNPEGILAAAAFNFPYENDQFDFVFLTSVFTHMTYVEFSHYLDEIYRVLKPGGKCMATMFLLDDSSDLLIARGKSSIAIIHPLNNCRVAVPEIPEAAVGYYKKDVMDWLSGRGFQVDVIYPGSWCGRENDWVSYQDIILFTKPFFPKMSKHQVHL